MKEQSVSLPAACSVGGIVEDDLAGLQQAHLVLGHVQNSVRIAAVGDVFLQGGVDLSRLRGVYKLMMTVMKKTAGKGLAEKENRTPEEDAMLDLLTNGGSRVSEENLAAVLEWLAGV